MPPIRWIRPNGWKKPEVSKTWRKYDNIKIFNIRFQWQGSSNTFADFTLKDTFKEKTLLEIVNMCVEKCGNIICQKDDRRTSCSDAGTLEGAENWNNCDEDLKGSGCPTLSITWQDENAEDEQVSAIFHIGGTDEGSQSKKNVPSDGGTISTDHFEAPNVIFVKKSIVKERGAYPIALHVYTNGPDSTDAIFNEIEIHDEKCSLERSNIIAIEIDPFNSNHRTLKFGPTTVQEEFEELWCMSEGSFRLSIEEHPNVERLNFSDANVLQSCGKKIGSEPYSYEWHWDSSKFDDQWMEISSERTKLSFRFR